MRATRHENFSHSPVRPCADRAEAHERVSRILSAHPFVTEGLGVVLAASAQLPPSLAGPPTPSALLPLPQDRTKGSTQANRSGGAALRVATRNALEIFGSMFFPISRRRQATTRER